MDKKQLTEVGNVADILRKGFNKMLAVHKELVEDNSYLTEERVIREVLLDDQLADARGLSLSELNASAICYRELKYLHTSIHEEEEDVTAIFLYAIFPLQTYAEDLMQFGYHQIGVDVDEVPEFAKLGDVMRDMSSFEVKIKPNLYVDEEEQDDDWLPF